MNNEKINLFDLTYSELESALVKAKQPKFRAQQLCDWLYKKLVSDTSLMLNLSKDLKELIDREFSLQTLKIRDIAHSPADNSYKFLFNTPDNKLIESILMFDKKRVTICVSCMIGCPLACKFCATGSQIGFMRKLSPFEIVGQVVAILNYARKNDITQKITNIVFMGMGEPFLNIPSMEKTIDLLTHPKCLALSPSKIAISTAGIGPGIADFINKTQVRLAVSIHFTTNELRSKYMPVNKKFPLEELLAELKHIKLKKRDFISIEYIMFDGINDSLVHAKRLVKLLHGLKVKLNLIPYNPTDTLDEKASDEATIRTFAQYFRDRGIFASVRYSKGVDVEGGCGQFAHKTQKQKTKIGLNPTVVGFNRPTFGKIRSPRKLFRRKQAS